MVCITYNNVFSSNNNWVVVLGASQHMTVELQLFDTVDISKHNPKLDHPDGSTVVVNKIRNMHLSNSMSFLDVFVVPDFHVTLLYAYKLCRDNKFQVVFF